MSCMCKIPEISGGVGKKMYPLRSDEGGEMHEMTWDREKRTRHAGSCDLGEGLDFILSEWSATVSGRGLM